MIRGSQLFTISAATLALAGDAPWGVGGLEYASTTWGNTAGGFVQPFGTGIGGTFVTSSLMIGVNATLTGLLFFEQTATVPSNRSLVVQVNGADVAALTLNLVTGDTQRSVFATSNVNQFDRIAIRHSTASPTNATCDIRCVVLVRPR